MLSLVGGPTAVLVALVAAALFETGRAARWGWVVAGTALVVANLALPVLRVPTTKGVKVEATRFEQWNAFSRVTVDDTRTIKIDASAATHVEDLRTLTPGLQTREISALGHAMFDPPAHTTTSRSRFRRARGPTTRWRATSTTGRTASGSAPPPRTCGRRPTIGRSSSTSRRRATCCGRPAS